MPTKEFGGGTLCMIGPDDEIQELGQVKEAVIEKVTDDCESLYPKVCNLKDEQTFTFELSLKPMRNNWRKMHGIPKTRWRWLKKYYYNDPIAFWINVNKLKQKSNIKG